ncbi:MAG: adenosylmethionine--8-amino-7-oxononanoate transaminase [Verrucomicrobiota bacterium]
MNLSDPSSSASLDKAHAWHPFTPLDEWLDPDHLPIMIASAKGSWLVDEKGKEYLDGNSSIWTNTHGHCHPQMVRALQEQVETLDHSSYLGLGHPLGSTLAQKLSQLTGLQRILFSSDGSSAMEAAIKIATQFFQQNGAPDRKIFITLHGAYHGDTVGNMSLGHSSHFHDPFRHLLFHTEAIPMPGCYQCPFNRASPEKADARTYRKCQWECVTQAEEKMASLGDKMAGLVIEPRVQGAAGMVMQPEGYLEKISAIPQSQGALLIIDEIFTGFGRTGKMLASQIPQLKPDIIALGKGLTGGTLPMAATALSETLFNGFRGTYDRTFFHGHSYTANPISSRAALTNLKIFDQEQTLSKIKTLSAHLRKITSVFWKHDAVGDVRQEGLILAVELVQNRTTKNPFPPQDRVAYKINKIAEGKGLLTRGIGSILFLVPPYSTTEGELDQMIQILDDSISEYFKRK